MKKFIFLTLLACFVFGTVYAQNAKAHIAQGQAHMKAGRFAEAVTSAEAALALAPKNKQAQTLLVEARNGGFNQAFTAAEGAFKANRLDEALAQLEIALTFRPGESRAVKLQTDIRNRQNRQRQELAQGERDKLAKEHYERGIAIFDQEIRGKQGPAIELITFLDMAISEFQEALKALDISSSRMNQDAARGQLDAHLRRLNLPINNVLQNCRALKENLIERSSRSFNIDSEKAGVILLNGIELPFSVVQEKTITIKGVHQQAPNKFMISHENTNIIIEANANGGYLVGIRDEQGAVFPAREAINIGSHFPTSYVYDTALKPVPEDFEVEQLPNNTLKITGYKGAAKNMIIPDTLFGLKVTIIGVRAFYERNLISLTIPDSVTLIEGLTDSTNNHNQIGAFSKNFLTKISLGSGIKTIQAYAFYGNKQLTELVIPASVAEIGDYAFTGCGLRSLTLGRNVQKIGRQAFANNVLTEMPTLPAGLKELRGFENNKIQTLTIPNGITLLEGIYGNPITTLVIPASLAKRTMSNADWSGRRYVLTGIGIAPGDSYWGNVPGDLSGLPLTRITMPANMDDLSFDGVRGDSSAVGIAPAGFESNFVNFYKGQGKRAGTYVKNGPVWVRE